MGKVTFDITTSLDGFITGPDDRFAESIDRLHGWIYELSSWRAMHALEGGAANEDSDIIDEAVRDVGAFVMGRDMFDVGEAPWGDTPPFHTPVFVVTHRPRDTVVKAGGTTFHFVTDGIEAALERARAAAGDRDILISGGANVIRQALEAGAVDEFQVHIAPVLFGRGIRLFEDLAIYGLELETTRVVQSPHVTHVKYRVVPPGEHRPEASPPGT